MFGLSTEQDRDADRQARRDEVRYYQDNRSCGACEAAWRIYSFDLAEAYPVVTSLPVHLENGQRVYFSDSGEALERQTHDPPDTPLTAWFTWNVEHGGRQG